MKIQILENALLTVELITSLEKYFDYMAYKAFLGV